ncbi:MAG: GTPase [Isosphaeraceae bacterium]
MGPFVRIMTSEGRGAIAVVRVWGRGAVESVDRVFHPVSEKSMAGTKPGRLLLGRVGDGRGDEVVAVRIEAASPMVEIQCHGGSEALRSVVAALEQAGAIRWNGNEPDSESDFADDAIAAQATADLSYTPTLRTAEILLDQVRGAFGRELEQLRHEIQIGNGRPVERINAMIGRGAVGMRLATGWKVALSGRPNVGKSRLLNALAGFARAIVDPTPGVTRDVVTFRTAFDGWPVLLADTAGIRETEDAVESLGIARSRREQADSDLVLLVLDRSEPLQPIDRELIAANPGALFVANKSDLQPAWDPEVSVANSSVVVTVSAEQGEGLETLLAAIVRRLVVDPPGPGDAVPFRPDHIVSLVQVRVRLLAADAVGALRRLAAIGTEPRLDEAVAEGP